MFAASARSLDGPVKSLATLDGARYFWRHDRLKDMTRIRLSRSRTALLQMEKMYCPSILVLCSIRCHKVYSFRPCHGCTRVRFTFPISAGTWCLLMACSCRALSTVSPKSILCRMPVSYVHSESSQYRKCCRDTVSIGWMGKTDTNYGTLVIANLRWQAVHPTCFQGSLRCDCDCLFISVEARETHMLLQDRDLRARLLVLVQHHVDRRHPWIQGSNR